MRKLLALVCISDALANQFFYGFSMELTDGVAFIPYISIGPNARVFSINKCPLRFLFLHKDNLEKKGQLGTMVPTLKTNKGLLLSSNFERLN